MKNRIDIKKNIYLFTEIIIVIQLILITYARFTGYEFNLGLNKIKFLSFLSFIIYYSFVLISWAIIMLRLFPSLNIEFKKMMRYLVTSFFLAGIIIFILNGFSLNVIDKFIRYPVADFIKYFMPVIMIILLILLRSLFPKKKIISVPDRKKIKIIIFIGIISSIIGFLSYHIKNMISEEIHYVWLQIVLITFCFIIPVLYFILSISYIIQNRNNGLDISKNKIITLISFTGALVFTILVSLISI